MYFLSLDKLQSFLLISEHNHSAIGCTFCDFCLFSFAAISQDTKYISVDMTVCLAARACCLSTRQVDLAVQATPMIGHEDLCC